MKTFWVNFKEYFFMGLGITFSLLSISLAARTTTIRWYTADDIFAAVIFGIIGFPLVINGLVKIKDENKNQT